MISLPEADFVVSPSGVARHVQKSHLLNRLPDADFVVTPDGVVRRVSQALPDRAANDGLRRITSARTGVCRSAPILPSLDIGPFLLAGVVAAALIASWLL